jgi:hypothetical protein
MPNFGAKRLKSGSLNLLEPSGPVKDCNGIVLPLPLLYKILINRLIGEPAVFMTVRQSSSRFPTVPEALHKGTKIVPTPLFDMRAQGRDGRSQRF